MSTRSLRALLAVAFIAGLASSSLAATVPLSELLDGGEFVSGDKIFSDFTYERNAEGQMPSPENVNVTDIFVDGNYGLRFQGAFVDSAGGGASDALITFNVRVPDDSDLLIVGANMFANPAVFAGKGMANVTETFVPTIEDDFLLVYDFGEGDNRLVDSIPLSGYKTLPVQKDIILHAMDDAGAVTLSFIDQTFVQEIPEPGSAALLIIGLVGLAFGRRKRLAAA